MLVAADPVRVGWVLDVDDVVASPSAQRVNVILIDIKVVNTTGKLVIECCQDARTSSRQVRNI